jgi:peroxiredoxin
MSALGRIHPRAILAATRLAATLAVLGLMPAVGWAANAAPPAAAKSPVGKPVADFLLKDLAGKSVALHDYKDKTAVVLFFMGVDCPISNLYLKDLADLSSRYGKQGLQIVGIQSNAGTTQARAAQHAREYNVAFPLLLDPGQRLAGQLGARRTAEIFLLDSHSVVRYHGALDDRYGYTFKRDVPQRHDLEEALKEVLAGKPVTLAETTPRGCLITRDERPASLTNVTYAKQISRILQRRCEECHRGGEVAPFALQSYDDAVEHSAMMKEVVLQRRMPPWHADPRYGHFSNDRRMEQDEIDQLLAWIDAGTPLGDAKELPAPRRWTSGWQIDKPDFVFELPEVVKVPATGTVDYQYYSVKTNLKQDIWIQAAEARPGNPAVVHHIIVFCHDPKDGDEDGFGGQHVCGVAPGDPPLVLPPGVARRIPAGAELIFQMHYTPNGKAATDRSKVGFVLYKGKDKPQHFSHTQPVMNSWLRIPPGDPNWKVESSYKFPRDAKIYQLMPHMHLRGKDFVYELKRPDGQTQVLLSVPQYDFNWQNTYRLVEPIDVPKGSTLHCVAHFDNSKDNPANPNPKKIVRWGDQTWEEMMIGWMTLAWTDEPPAKHAASKPSAAKPDKPAASGAKASDKKTTSTTAAPQKIAGR